MTKYDSTLINLEKHIHRGNILLVVEGAMIGLIAGLTAVLYRYCISGAESLLYTFCDYAKKNPHTFALWFIALAALAILVARIVRWEPLSSGSGIPQVTGEIKGYLNPGFFKIIIAKFVGGTASVLGGLSLGREGPSIQLGAMAAKGVSRAWKLDKTQEIALISCGAGAGLAAAFNAPLAGIIFVLEEIHKTFNSAMLVAGMVACVVADFTSKVFFGQKAIFTYNTSTVPLRFYWLLALLGIILGLLGAGYNVAMLKTSAFFKKLTAIPMEIKILFPFMIAGVLAIFLPQVLCGGHEMVEILETSKPTISLLLLLLVAKFVFSAISFGSGVPGGIFFPLLVLGSYVGAIFGSAAINIFPISSDLWPQFIILGMAGIFAGIVRAPITGIVLITEMTGDITRMLDLAVVSIIAYVTANFLNSKPIYSSLLDNILKNQKELDIQEDAEKILVTYIVPFDSQICNKKISEIEWQKNTLVASILREDHTITPKGDTVIQSGDTLKVLIGQQFYAEDNAAYEKMIYGEE